MRKLGFLIVYAVAGLLCACGGGGGSTLPTATPTPVKTASPTPTPIPFVAVAVTFGAVPSAVAVQVGTGASWQSATPNGTALTIKVPASATTYGLAYVCPQQSNGAFANNQEFIIQATTTDATSLNAPCPTSTPASGGVASISGTFDVSAIPGAIDFETFVGGPTNGPMNGPTGMYSGAANAGVFDVVSLAYSDAGSTVVGGSILRSQTITNGLVLNIPPFTTANEGTRETIALPAPQNSYIPFATVTYITAGGTRAPLANPSVMTSYGALPQSVQQPGDYYDARCALTRLTVSGLESLQSEQTFTTPASVTFVVPTAVPVPVLANSPYPTFSFNNAELGSGQIFDFAQMIWGSSNAVTIYVSSAWLASNTTYTPPNLSSLSPVFLAPTEGSSVTWSSSSNSSTLPFATTVQNSSQPLVPNASRETLQLSGNYTAT